MVLYIGMGDRVSIMLGMKKIVFAPTCIILWSAKGLFSGKDSKAFLGISPATFDKQISRIHQVVMHKLYTFASL